MKACPLLRPATVYGAADMVLSIPDNNENLLYHSLHKVFSLILVSANAKLHCAHWNVLSQLSTLLHQWPRGKADSMLNPEDVDVFDVRYIPDDPVTGASTAPGSGASPTQGFEAVSEAQIEMLRHFQPFRVEAVALVFLCQPYPNIRALAIEILQSVRSIAAALSEASLETEENEVCPLSLVLSPELLMMCNLPTGASSDACHGHHRRNGS